MTMATKKQTAAVNQDLVDAVKAYARENYEQGWDEVIECYEDKDIWEVIAGARTPAGAIRKMRAVVDIRKERREEIQAEADELADQDVVSSARCLTTAADQAAPPESSQPAAPPQESPEGEESAPASKKPESRECLCGCGGTTGGGRFIPGHDAKLASALLGAFRGEGLTPEQQELVAQLGWEAKVMRPAPAKPASKGKAQDKRSPGELADLRGQLGRAIDAARDRTRTAQERLEAVHWLDRLVGAPLTPAGDLEAIAWQFDGEHE
jgi:hypothetical protein